MLQDVCISERFADDLNNYTVQRSAEAHQRVVSAVWSKTWGPNAVNLEKRVNATKVVSNIGFRVNLSRESIRPEDKGLQKLFILFFVVFKPYDKMPLKHRQAIASTAQTYVNAMWGMWSMVAPLHQMCKGTEFEWRAANSTQRQCAEHWQAALMATFRDYSLWEVPIRTLGLLHKTEGLKPHYSVMSDASELAAGLFIFDGLTNKLLVWSRVFFKWGKDAAQSTKRSDGKLARQQRSAQNLREFLPIILLMIMVAQSELPSDGAIIDWVGDNTSALAWANTHRCSSEERQTQLAFIALSLCEQATHIKLHHTTQIKSAQMGIVDSVSRTETDEGVDEDIFKLKENPDSFDGILQLVDLCNPYNDVGGTNDHHEAYIRVSRIMTAVKHGIPDGKPKC
jgi:hypothetical protein